MSDINAHALEPAWAEPPAENMQEFFDTLSESYVRDEPLLIQETTKVELDYITARAAEAALAREAGSVGAVDDEAEEVEVNDPPAAGRQRVLRRACSGEPVQLGRITQQPPLEHIVHETRAMKAAAAKKAAKATVAKRTATASSVSKQHQTLSPSPPDSTLEAEFVLGSFSPARKRKLVEEEVEEEELEMLAQRVVKRAKASMSDKPPVGTSHPSSADRQDIDTVIEEVARGAAAEADKIAAEEAAKTAAEDATKGPAGEAGKAATEEGVVDNQPSSSAASGSGKYLKVSDDLFIHLPGTASTRAATEGEVFADEGLAAAGLEVVDEPSAVGSGSQEQQLLWAMSANFQKLQELVLKQADVEKAQEAAKELAAKDEAARYQHQAELNSQEEDLAAREEALAATLRGKDEEVEKLAIVLGKAELLSKATDSISDLKLKLEGLEGTLSEVRAREETLTKDLEEERQLRRNDAAEHKEYAEGINRWVSRLADVAGRTSTKLASMGMPHVRYSREPNLRSNRVAYLANEARRICRGALTKVLTKVAFWNPTVNFANALESLPEEADLAVPKECIKPIIDCVDGVERVEGQRWD
nr:uncharacterized protein LOC120975722 [Aegilops tauschii subsp. strangulata]